MSSQESCWPWGHHHPPQGGRSRLRSQACSLHTAQRGLAFLQHSCIVLLAWCFAWCEDSATGRPESSCLLRHKTAFRAGFSSKLTVPPSALSCKGGSRCIGAGTQSLQPALELKEHCEIQHCLVCRGTNLESLNEL